MTRVRAIAATAALLLAGVSGMAQAVPIPGLFNTGVDAFGVSVGGLPVPDLHYTITSSPPGGGAITPAIVTIPHPSYFANDAISQWISNVPDAATTSSVAGVYVFKTIFDLTGYDPATASITGGWSTDNPGIFITLNSTTSFLPTLSDQFLPIHGFAPFALAGLASGFGSGINTLTFTVLNEVCAGGCTNPVALRVAMTSDVTAVPEPGTWALLLAGLAALSVVAKRRVH